MAEPKSNTKRPVVGVTTGDPAGIGPEVVIAALGDDAVRDAVRAVVIGDKAVLERTCKLLGSICGVIDHQPAERDLGAGIEVIDLKNCTPPVEFGKISRTAGKAAGEYIEKVFGLWSDGKIDAVCTAPINKESMNLGGYDYPGHTEFFASLAGVERFAMSFFAGKLRVVLLSTHLPLLEAIGLVNKTSVAELIEFTDRTLSKILGRNVSIAVAGLNPHASENGKFGREEHDAIAPAIDACKSKGLKVFGPFPPDTVFLRGHSGEFDAVIALYHDQATIPVKALSFGSAVNVTLGLPFVRTSVDHGTAFDIAGKGIADESSMRAAILLAGELASSVSGKPTDGSK